MSSGPFRLASLVHTINTVGGCSLKEETRKKDNSQKLTACIKEMAGDNWNILGIGPTHWMGEGTFRIVDHNNGTDYLVIHCGNGDTARRGVAIVVSKQLQLAVTSCDFVSYRIVSVDLDAQLQDLGLHRPGTVVQVYVPRQENVQIEHDTFWQQLRHLVDSKLQQGRWVLVMGSASIPAEDYLRSNFRNYTIDLSIYPHTQGGKNSTFVLFMALIWPRMSRPSIGPFEVADMIVGIRSANAFRVSSYPIHYKYEITNSQINWSPLAVQNNQPSAAHVSVYAVQHQHSVQEVVKLTNSTDIRKHFHQLLFEANYFTSRPKQQIDYTRQCSGPIEITLRVNPLLCANASGLEFDKKPTTESPLICKDAEEFAARTNQLMGYILTVTNRTEPKEFIFYWGGMTVATGLCPEHLLGKFLLSQLSGLMSRYRGVPWNPHIFCNQLFLASLGTDGSREVEAIAHQYGLMIRVSPTRKSREQ